MEEDEQAGPETEKKEKEEEEPRRCGRHPSQLLTGICSSCLMERLSSVREQPAEAEIVEVEGSAAAAGADTGGRLRKTLMLLFQLDDSSTEAGEPQVAEIGAGSGGEGDRGGGGRRKSGSWLRSILPRRRMPWRRTGSSVKAPSLPPRDEPVDPSGGGPSASSLCFGSSGHGDGRDANVRVERKLSFRRSSDWRVDREPSRSSVEPPRHSWDGAMVGRALSCTFACLEDPSETARREPQSNVEEEMVGETRGGDAESRNGGDAESRNGGRHSVDEGSEGPCIRGRSRGDARLEMGVGRRRSNRWSRVWDRSITSPLKEFVKKREHVLERSLSESRKEVRRGRNAEAVDVSAEIQPERSSSRHGSGRASQGASRSSSQAASIGDVQSFRADFLKNKECKIGRSRSVHYTSPGNLDNGMLRFYLTPMRSTRTANRGRRRNSRLFGRGLFGFI